MRITKAAGILGAFAIIVPLSLVMCSPQDESTDSVGPASDSVPAEYRDIVNRAGNICDDITGPMIAAQIEAESNWNPDAVSYAGASGISQFMPATWAGSGMDGDGDGKADITNPQDAIWSQGNYMCALRDDVMAAIDAGTLSGDVADLTLAAYNAGLGSVQIHGGIPPFPETQSYVQKINAAIPQYSGPGGNAPGEGASGVVQAGKAYLGRPYRGEGPGGLDCCVFVQSATRDALDIELPLSAPAQPPATAKCEWAMQNNVDSYGGTQISLDEIEPGDLLFHQSSSISASVDSVTHVSIYVGDGQVMDSLPGYGVGIRDMSFYDSSDPILSTAVRLPEG